MEREIETRRMENQRKSAVLYVHGKGGSANEASHYQKFFPGHDAYGLDYQTFTPWETKPEIQDEIDRLKRGYDAIILIANSIGAYFSMNAEVEHDIKRAYFISPIVNMEKLITDMMLWAKVTEEELKAKQEIETAFGETLSWNYLTYVRNHPLHWNVPTEILYGSRDNLTAMETVAEFAGTHHAQLTVMENGEHWFHTEEQMAFLDNWLKAGTD